MKTLFAFIVGGFAAIGISYYVLRTDENKSSDRIVAFEKLTRGWRAAARPFIVLRSYSIALFGAKHQAEDTPTAA